MIFQRCDKAGNLLSVTDPNKNVTLYTYDEKNQLIKITDALEGEQVFEYDRMGIIKEVDALNNEKIFTYDREGNLKTILNGKKELFTYEYNELNQLVTEINYQQKEQTYTYDPAGNLITKTDFNRNKL